MMCKKCGKQIQMEPIEELERYKWQGVKYLEFNYHDKCYASIGTKGQLNVYDTKDKRYIPCQEVEYDPRHNYISFDLNYRGVE